MDNWAKTISIDMVLMCGEVFVISNESYCLCSTESCDFIFLHKIRFSHLCKRAKLHCFVPPLNGDDPFSVSGNVLRQPGK